MQTDKNLAVSKVKNGQRLDFQDAMSLYQSDDIILLGSLARAVKERKSGRQVFFNVNRHINLTNICHAKCPLCAFGRDACSAGAYVMEKDDVAAVVSEARNIPGLSEIHMVSALHPDKPFEYYLEIVGLVKDMLPGIHLKAFTAVEIVHFAAIAGLTVKEVLLRLKNAGLDSMPGGGAEILSDDVRAKICPRKASTAEWIDVITTAHTMGIPTNATMLYGHVETIEQRIKHLLTLRAIQDKTGGFQAYVGFPFHPENTKLTGLSRVSAWEDLKMLAIARLVLDNISHVKAFWMMLSMPVAQLALAFGVDDLDGTVAEEKIIHAAGAKTGTNIDKADLIRIITETGYEPVERDTFYRPLIIQERSV